MQVTSPAVLAIAAVLAGGCSTGAGRAVDEHGAPVDGSGDAGSDASTSSASAEADSAGDDGDGGEAGASTDAADASSSDEGSTGEPGCAADLCAQDGVCMPCDSSYWSDVDRDIATTPYGHRTAIACHNCYASTLAATLTKLHDAQQAGADLLELDLTHESGSIVVEHDDGGGADGPLLVDVLMDPALQAGDQLLNIELKETAPTEAFVAGVLDAVVGSGCVREGRPLLLRAFVSDSRLENLLLAQELLRAPAYAEIAPHVRLHALLGDADGNSAASLVDAVDENAARGFAAIEFQVTTRGLLTGVHRAESLGLGTSVWTVPDELGDMHVAALRDEVDSITSEYSVASARARVEADNARVYLDATAQDVDADAVVWRGDGSDDETSAPIGQDERPGAESGSAGDALLGTSLGFVAAELRSLPLVDVVTPAGGGVLVAALVRFDVLALPDGSTMTVLGKANSGAWALELFNPEGATGTVLRFGVHVDGGYHYASLPAGSLGTARSVWVVGAYDGDGAVRLLVDHTAAGTTTANASGGITVNDAVVQLGADPQDPDPPRFFFEGAIQTAIVQAWP